MSGVADALDDALRAPSCRCCPALARFIAAELEVRAANAAFTTSVDATKPSTAPITASDPGKRVKAAAKEHDAATDALLEAWAAAVPERER